MGRPSLPPGIYFRILLVGYFEGIDSERGIAWRTADSLALRSFLGYELNESPPDHSTISRTRRLVDIETHQAVFTLALDHALRSWEHFGMRSETYFSSAIVFAAALVLISCGTRPPLRITSDPNGVEVDVQTLGEYPTPITRIALTNANSQRKVWELRALTEDSQLARFRLVPGRNLALPSDVVHGNFEVVIPAAGASFQLHEGTTYELRVWGKSLRPRVARFLLNGRKPAGDDSVSK